MQADTKNFNYWFRRNPRYVWDDSIKENFLKFLSKMLPKKISVKTMVFGMTPGTLVTSATPILKEKTDRRQKETAYSKLQVEIQISPT